MKWSEYLPLAENTLSTQFNCSDEFHQKILHAVIGSLTEVEEILENYVDGKIVGDINSQGSVGEEAADVLWYISILFRELKIENTYINIEDEFKIDNSFNTLLSFTKVSLKFLDLLKKKIYYNKDISNIEMINNSIKMYLLITHYCTQNGADVSKILDKNIAKLKQRYGDKFSSERAINRDLDSEKEILEKS